MAVRRLLGVALVAAALVVIPRSDAATEPVEGDVLQFGDAAPLPVSAGDDVVDLAGTPTGVGWWATDSGGAVTAAGDAAHLGDLRTRALNEPIVTIAGTPSGRGYWLVASDGGVFTFGDAPYLGSTGALRLNQPIVAMAATRTGRGYWLVASDGGVFTFGDARFHGSTGALRLNEPIVAIAPTTTGRGYWLVAGDGGVFTFGDARFRGTASWSPATRATDAAASPGGGYWILGAHGGVAAFGGAADVGSAAGKVRDGTAVGFVPSPTGLGYRFAIGRVRDVVTVWQPGGMTESSRAWAEAVARDAGGRVVLRHRANLDLDAGSGWRIPLALVTYEPGVARPLLGAAAWAAIGRGDVVVGREAARLRNAAVGSTMTLLGWDGRPHGRRVGAVVPDARLAWAEVALATGDAASMGVSRPFAVDIWGAARQHLDDALATAPTMPHRLGVGRSWDPPSPDDTLPNVQLKRTVGEVAYRPGRGDAVALDPAWVQANIASVRVPVLGTVTCHRAVIDPLRGALGEVARAGLGGGLGRYGGCYAPRRIRGGDSGGFLSRHSFGVAIDVNITRNTFGGRVDMDPRIVEIFRRWGFAWGGTWVRADGMHFEYRGS